MRFGWLLLAATTLLATDSSEFFEMRVRPVLIKNCYTCHTSAQMGGLQLDTREHVLKGGKSGAAIVPGDPEKSLLIQAVRQTHERLKMPPNGKLPDQDIENLTVWVKDGAVWGSSAIPIKTPEYVITSEQRAFWSFQPVRDPTPPAVKETSWARSPIDEFVLAKLEAAGLRPARPADKRTLIRRVTFDLTGLPPTPAEVESFLSDGSGNAFEKVVDRLLASPHYGERWGRYWLDVARYSDDRLDSERENVYPNAFRYRDWVIESFNNDMPYDLFVKAQIAGDLLPAADRENWSPAWAFTPSAPNFRTIALTPQHAGLWLLRWAALPVTTTSTIRFPPRIIIRCWASSRIPISPSTRSRPRLRWKPSKRIRRKSTTRKKPSKRSSKRSPAHWPTYWPPILPPISRRRGSTRGNKTRPGNAGSLEEVPGEARQRTSLLE